MTKTIMDRYNRNGCHIFSFVSDNFISLDGLRAFQSSEIRRRQVMSVDRALIGTNDFESVRRLIDVLHRMLKKMSVTSNDIDLA